MQGTCSRLLQVLGSSSTATCASSEAAAHAARILSVNLLRGTSLVSSRWYAAQPERVEETSSSSDEPSSSQQQQQQQQQSESASSQNQSASSSSGSSEDPASKFYNTFKSGYENVKSKIGGNGTQSLHSSRVMEALKDFSEDVKAAVLPVQGLQSMTRLRPEAIPLSQYYSGPAELVLVQQQQTAWQKRRQQVAEAVSPGARV